MKQVHRTRGIVRALIVVGTLSLAALPSHATLLSLTLPQNPDIAGGYLTITYTASTDNFHAQGYSTSYDSPDPSSTHYDLFSNYTLDATITGAGQLTGGSFTISGDIGNNDEVLLTGNLNPGAEGVDFGATSANGGLFQFLFTVSGGSLSNDFGGIGAQGAAIMDPVTGGFTDDWSVDFANADNGDVDHKVIPEPSSFFLLVLGTALCVATHRRRKHARVP